MSGLWTAGSGLWVAAGLVFLVAYGFWMFHLGVNAAWRDAQEKIDLIRWATMEQEKERMKKQAEEDRRKTALLMDLDGRTK